MNNDAVSYEPETLSTGERRLRQVLLVVARLGLGQESSQGDGRKWRGLVDGKGAGFTIGSDGLASQNLGRLDVGLVKGLDTEQMSGDGGRHFPEEKLPAQGVFVGNIDAENRIPGIFQRSYTGVVCRVTIQPQMDEQTIIAISVR